MNNPMMVPAELMLGLCLAASPPSTTMPGVTLESDPFETARLTIDPDDRIARARLSLMRADGVELAWIEGLMRVPQLEGRRLLPDVVRFEAPFLDQNTGTTEGVGESLRFEVDRNTVLRDGGISGEQAMPAGDDGLMRLTSLAAGEGEYDIYDLSLTWDAYTPGPVTVSVIGGLKAIDARIGKVVDDAGTATFRDARGVVAVPVVGGGVSWRLNPDVVFSGTASTHTFGAGSVVDLSAETSLRLSPNVGLSAGYQFIRSAIEVQSLEADLEREGIFARVQIRF
jgi:hypothetical protein